MKIGLLKKLRTEAYRMYGIKGFIELGGGGGGDNPPSGELEG